MKYMYALLVVSFLVVSPSFVDAAKQAAQVHLSIELPTTPKTWWQQLTGFLGIRAVRRMHPEPGTKLRVQSSAYASSPYQTDSTPCITAAGTRVRPGVVATNFLPMGTILEINGEKYIVEDRMNPRYEGYYLDLWFPSTSEALVFGRKGLEITIVDYGKPGQDIREEKAIPTPEPTPDRGFLNQVKNGVSSLASGFASFIGARSPAELNKHDVNCFTDDVLSTSQK